MCRVSFYWSAAPVRSGTTMPMSLMNENMHKTCGLLQYLRPLLCVVSCGTICTGLQSLPLPTRKVNLALHAKLSAS